jgi:hypothetical protein
LPLGNGLYSESVNIAHYLYPVTAHHWFLITGGYSMQNQRQPIQSHEDREAQKLMKRIEETQASQNAAKAADTTRTLDDYRKKVGS